MCGIAGEWHPESEVDGHRVIAMLAALGHRGPDGGGLWIGAAAALGHRRLAIHDLTPAGTQPFISREGDLVVAVNGTFHNAPELEGDPAVSAFPRSSRSDSELLIPLWRAYGTGCLSRLRGPFALAVYEVNQRRLHLARDPLGKKPLHWSVDPDGFLLFASEMGSLLRVHPSPCIAPSPAVALLQAGYVPGGETLVEGIRTLPPATWLRADESGIHLERYWTPPVVEDGPRTLADATAALEAVLVKAVRQRTRTDRPLGVLLSGGLDSAGILALAQETVGHPLPSFTLGFDDPRFDERPLAAATAGHLGSPHHQATFDVDPGPWLASLIRVTGEPLADPSWLPTALVCREARERAVVLLSGDGSDEVLLGYRRHGVARLAGRLRPEALRRLVAAGGWILPRSRARDFVTSLADGPAGALADLVGLVSRADLRQEIVAGALRDKDPLTASYASIPPATDGAALAGRLDLLTYLPGDLLPKMDRGSMASGVEVWSPFLDLDVVETALRIPGSVRRRLFLGKRPLRHMLATRLPPAVLRRRKRGFGVPLASWLGSGPYAGFARIVLGDVTAPFDGILPEGRALPLLDRLQRGETHLAPLVHACIVLALFHDTFIRGTP